MYLLVIWFYLLDTKGVQTLYHQMDGREHVKRLFETLIRDDSGQDMIEYALVSTLLALSSMAVLRSYNVHIINSLGGVGSQLTNAIQPAGH
jgi:pilus assembly protein Flp/PilA